MEALFSRSGSSAEAAFREGLRKIVREAGYTVEYYQGQDPQGYINYDPGRSYDLDVLVLNGAIVAVEVKSSVGSTDVVRFARTVSLFEQQTGRRVTKKVLIAASIQPEARQRAPELGVVLGIDTRASQPSTLNRFCSISAFSNFELPNHQKREATAWCAVVGGQLLISTTEWGRESISRDSTAYYFWSRAVQFRQILQTAQDRLPMRRQKQFLRYSTALNSHWRSAIETVNAFGPVWLTAELL